MVCDGMVAVVHGLQDAGLAVTVLDGNHQYTLMPNHGILTESQLKRNLGIACQMASVHVGTESNANSSNSSAQACDGRYTSVYRASHCNSTPTSPPPLLTEFPPQKPFVYKGHGNFEVGGSGSGDKDYIPIKASGNFRGGMCWPDRGSVCTPRASHEPDAFANSLRKYPSMSPERSTEIVERLISYTQGKNSLRHQTKSITSPTRTVDSNISAQNLDRSSRTISRSLQKNIYEPEVTLRVRRMEESPTRDRSRTRREECMKSIYGRTYDVRHVRDGVKREKARNPGFYPYTQPACASIREKYVTPNTESVNAVNMEIQAAVPMVSREVATTPRVEPMKRTIAVPLSPITSSSCKPEGGVSQHKNGNTYNFITTPKPVLTYPKSVQVTASSIEFNIDDKKRLFDRKSKSNEDVRINANRDVVQLFKNLKPNNKTDKIILKGLDKVLDTVGTLNKGDKVQIKVGSVKKYTNSSSGNPVRKDEPSSSKPINVKHASNIFRAELNSTKGFVKSNVIDNIIKDWIANINLKNRDFLNRNIDKEEIVNTLRSRLQYIVYNRPKDDKIKSEIIEALEDVPLYINGNDRKTYISNIVDTLLSSIENIPLDEYPNIKLALDNDEINNNEKKDSKSKIKKNIQPTEEELKEFIVAELMDFLDKHDLKISFNIFDEVEMELVDILMDSYEAVRQGELIYVKEEIIALVHEVNWFSARQSKCFADTILAHLGNMLRGNVKESKIKSQTVLVMQSSCQNSPRNKNANNTTDFSIDAITESDIDNNLDYYMNQLTQQIDEWLGNLSLTCCTDKGFRQVVVNDLAAEIIDRHKYIERNPENRGTCKDELEHLRYEIYKWINKLVGEDNTSTLEHAPELMQRIRSIPVPMLTMPNTAHGQVNNTVGILNNSNFSSTKIGNVSQGSSKNKTPCQKCCGSREDSSNGGQGMNQSQKIPSSSYSGTRVPGVDDGQMPMFSASEPCGSMMDQQRPLSNSSRRKSSPGSMAMSGACQMRSQGGFGPEAIGPSGIYSGIGNAMQMGPSDLDSGLIAQGICCAGGENYNQMFGPSVPGGSLLEQQAPPPNNNRRKSSPDGCAMSSTCRQIPMRSTDGLGPEYFQMSPNSFDPGSTVRGGTCSGNQMPMFGPSGQSGSMMEQREMPRPNKRFSGPASFATGPMISGGTYPGQTGFDKSGSSVCNNTRQPGTCCPDEDGMPMFGPAGPGGSMKEQRGVGASDRRPSGPGGFSSGPMASALHPCGMYANQMGGPQDAMGVPQGGMGGQGASSGGMYGGSCCNDANQSQGRLSTSGRGVPLPQCCQGQQQFGAEPGMNYSRGYIGNSQMNSNHMPLTGSPEPGIISSPCGPKSFKRSLTNPSDSSAGPCPARMDPQMKPQTYGLSPNMFGGARGGFVGEGPPSSCCGGIQRGQMSMFEQVPGGSMMQPRGTGPSDRRYSSPGALPTGYTNEINPHTQGQDFSPTPCCPGMQVTPTMPSVIQLNEEYDEFVKNWVKDIPILANSPEEQAFADKARLGIYNGVWKSLTKLKFNPATFHNKFYYEDVFDDDIEELLGMLPLNPELDAKKHLLKVSLIEKTTTTNEILKSIIAPSMYRQQLVDNVANNLPKRVTDVRGEDPTKLHEELKILNLAEDYILFARYKDDDKVKANVYKKKLLKKAEELVEEVKRTHGQELKDVDPGMYINDILSALHKVPVPSEETVKEEADEILLGLEIEQWFSDLPLVQNDNHQEQLNRRRLRDALAKKIHEMEKVVNLADCSADRELKHEVSKFLEKLPLQRDQDLNINFMVDELTNRMKNRPREGAPGSGSVRKKSVAFEVPMDYDDFSRNMQCCSSFSELPGGPPSQFNQSSMHMQGAMNQYGGASQNDCCKNGQAFNSMNQRSPVISLTPNVQSSQQWQTLNDSQAHCQICPPSKPCPQNQTYQNQDQWQTLNESQPLNQVYSSGRSNMAPNQTYESQGGFEQQQYSTQMGQASLPQQPCPNQIGISSFAQLRCPSQMGQGRLSYPGQMGQAGTAQEHLPNQFGQPRSSQQSNPCQMGQTSSSQPQVLNQIDQSSMFKQYGTCQMGEASISQQQYTNRMGQSGSQQSGTMGHASIAQQRRISQTGHSGSPQHQITNQMGPSSLALQSGTCQMGQASPSQMDRTQELGTKSCCPSPVAQASSAQQQIGQSRLPQQYPDQMDQSSSALKSDSNEMGQVISGQRSGQRRGDIPQAKTDNRMDQSKAQSCCQGPMDQGSSAQQQRLSQVNQGHFGQQEGSGPYEMDSELEKSNVSQQTYQGPSVRRYSQQPQEQQPPQQQQRKCENCSSGAKNTASSQRLSPDNKRSVSPHNISKIGTVRDHLQSPKTVLRRHSKCFEESPQPYQKASGRSNLNQRGKAFYQARRPRTPNRSSQTTSPSDQNFCGPTCPSTVAAKSSSNAAPQDSAEDTNASNTEYVQGHRSEQKQNRVSNAQPIGYSSPREGVGERRRRTDNQRQEEGRIEVEDMEEEVETERDESRCRCMERMFRCRRKRPTCFQYEKFDNECPNGGFSRCFPGRFRPPCYF